MLAESHSEPFIKRQVIPLALTFAICGVLALLLYGEISLLNRFISEDIVLTIRWFDIIVGLAIYLKTSIDFAIYIGHLMTANRGWKARIAIELGTAIGNAAGTMAILAVWAFFKEVRWLLALMIFVAGLVLIHLAEESLEHAKIQDRKYPDWFRKTVSAFEKALDRVNKWIAPVLRYIVPHMSVSSERSFPFWKLFVFSFTVPFLLGLDDFAGYVPVFTIVNVFGFAVGVFAGHMVLNILLYLSPARTIRMVKNPVISFLGSVAFVILAVWGFIEVIRLIGA